jgi:hypothetical protein
MKVLAKTDLRNARHSVPYMQVGLTLQRWPRPHFSARLTLPGPPWPVHGTLETLRHRNHPESNTRARSLQDRSRRISAAPILLPELGASFHLRKNNQSFLDRV